MNPCPECDDTGRVVDHWAGQWVPCRACGYQAGAGVGATIAMTVSVLAMLAVAVLLAIAWFGDLQSIPLIGK